MNCLHLTYTAMFLNKNQEVLVTEERAHYAAPPTTYSAPRQPIR